MKSNNIKNQDQESIESFEKLTHQKASTNKIKHLFDIDNVTFNEIKVS